jgi:hypothetical protein
VQWTVPLGSVTANPSFKLLAQAEDFCGNVGTPPDFLPVNVKRPTCFQEGQTAEAAPTAAWSSELTVPGGHGQVVLNGTQAAFPGPFRSALDLRARRGANRLEAVLVQGEGKPGLWRFDLAGIAPGSLRVVSGEVALVTEDAIVFRLKGRPGERMVFTFSSESSGRGSR